MKIFEKYDLDYITLVHPSAIIAKSVKLGSGAVVLAGAIINADAKIGKQSIINTSAVVEHDCVIGEFTMVASRATVCGFSKIGNNCWLGAGSVVNNVISICNDTVIGSGAAVVKNISEEASKRIFIKGEAVLSLEGAEFLAKEKIYLFGNESQTVGDGKTLVEVHKVLLSEEIVLLEGIRLSEVREGIYLLFASPLSFCGAEGSPCRAVLVDMQKG